MTWWQIESLARAGVTVRRASWATGTSARTLSFQSGAGSDRAVAVIREGAEERVSTTLDFTSEDFLASDWQTV